VADERDVTAGARMNGPVPIREGMLWVGVNDRETDLFEGLWPMPAGISYNATLILDEKIALIDAVGSAFLPELLEKLRAVLPPGRAPDYLVINHVEPDHAGAAALLLSLFPSLRIVGNARTLDLLGAFRGTTEASGRSAAGSATHRRTLRASRPRRCATSPTCSGATAA
jgi:flavorubredoxin